SGPSGALALVTLLLAACAEAGGATTTAAAPTAAAPSTSLPVAAPLVVEGPGRYDGEVVSGGLLRRFVLVVPESASDRAPLVIVFHGFMGSPEELEESIGMTALAAEEGFLVVYPEGAGRPRRWRSDPRQGDGDVAFIRDLVALLGDAVGIDWQRVYTAGMSNGGGMAARLACDASDLVAAAGAVAGAYPTGDCSPGRPVPVVAFHGTADPIVPYEGWGALLPAVEDWATGWADRNGCASDSGPAAVTADVTRRHWGNCAAGADVVLYTVAGGRHGWPGSGRATGWSGSTDSVDASALLWEFFAAHPLP
ncbi:MAG TPA: PHB depolymerase family esterase, partial [Acidimicrobiia bacterium]|nr:PHB depolymerase family esterase [Acidimicrobiia bacterium]